MLPVPVRAHFSTQENISSDTSHTKRKIVVNLAFHLLRLSNLGDSFRAEAGVRVGVEVALAPHTTPSLPVVLSHINDNQCVLSPPVQLKSKFGDLNLVSSANKVTFQKTVNLHVVLPAVSVKGPLQKKNVRPSHSKVEIKSVNSALSVNQCLFAPNVTNVTCVVKDPPVGGRLQLFWQVWLSLGSNPRVVSTLREGYQLPFKERPPLARFPVIVSGSSAPLRNKNLSEALQSLGQKQAIEKVSVQSSLCFYNRLFLFPKPNKKWRPILDLSQLNLYLAPATFKMETPETIRLSLQQGEWVTSLDFSDAYFYIPISHRSRKYLRFHIKGQTFQFTALPFGLSTAPLEFTKVVKEVKLMAQSQGIRIYQYLDDWLLRAPCREICLRHTQTLLDLCRSLGWVVSMDKSELVPQQTFDFVGYHFDLSQGLVKPTQERWRSLCQKLNLLLGLECCTVRQFMSLIGLLTATEKQVVSGRLYMRPIQWHLKKHWHAPESLEKVIPIPSSLHVHLRWWLDPTKVLLGQPLHPLQHALQLFTDASNEGWGAHLGNYMAKGVWLKSENALHINFGTQSSPSGLKTVRAVVLQPDSSCLYGQHHCGLLHQQGRGYEIRLTLCPPLEADALVQSKADCPEGQAYPGSPECHSRQTVQTQSGDPNRMVPPPGGFCSDMPALAPSVSGPVCHPVQSQTSPVCIPGSRPVSVGSGCLKSPLGGPGRLCVPPDGTSTSGGNKTFGPRIPSSHPDSTRLAQHALVLGPGQHVSSNSPPAPSGVEFDNSTVQSVSSQGPSQSEPSCLAPRASAIQQAGFSAEVATRIEAPQRRSTRAVYEWSVFVRWCEKNKVDVRTPSIKQIADFLLSLFQEKHLQPSTIEGYRTAIADKVGNSRIHISKDENLTRLLDSFHRDKPKGRRGVPTWNLSLVLHQLTKPPFEPLRKASLKHLTFKTVFLLALGSGKRRSEIHAWVHRNIRHQEDWSNVSLSLSPSFISKNNWLRRVPLVWPLLSFQPWLLPWKDPSRRIGVCARSGHSVITWTKPKISAQARIWFLFPLLRVSRRILSRLQFPPGSNKPLSYVTSCQTNRLNNYIRFGLMTFARSWRPKPFRVVFP